MINIKVPITFTAEQIGDLLCTAFAGGSNYWIEEVIPHKVDECTYIHEIPLNRGILYIKTVDNDTVTLTPESLEKGLQVLADNYAWFIAHIINDNADAETADVFLQCCVFGDLVYS